MHHRYHIWGEARGPATLLSPHIRVVVGAALLGVTFVSRSDDVLSAALVLLAAGSWASLAEIPSRRLATVAAYGLIVFLPLYLIVGAAGGFSLLIAWKLLGKSISAMIVAITTAGMLSVSDLHRALAHLPVPPTVASVIVQIAHQAGMMVNETARTLQAIRVRAATPGGLPLQVTRPLASVWMSRVFFKAERTADAMEVRGFARHVPGFALQRLTGLDRYALAFLALYCVVLLLRYW